MSVEERHTVRLRDGDGEGVIDWVCDCGKAGSRLVEAATAAFEEHIPAGAQVTAMWAVDG